MRPLLSVVLVPSMPMKEDRLSTAGSFRIDVGQRLLPLRHRGERNVLRRFGNAQDHAGILHREKALGHDRCTDRMVATRVPTATSSVIVLISQHDIAAYVP